MAHQKDFQLCGSRYQISTIGSVLLLFFTSFIALSDAKTLSLGSRQASRSQPITLDLPIPYESSRVNDIEVEAPVLIRSKRDTTNNSARAPGGRIDPPVVNKLDDSHNQLVVYWAGLDVIICLAKDTKPGTPSTLYISTDYGSSFKNVSNKVLLEETNASNRLPMLEKFYNHPKNNGRFIFTDTQSKYIFTTKDYGVTFKQTKLDFVPDEVTFDPNSDRNLVAYETTTEERHAWVSVDYGQSWSFVEESVKSVTWDDSTVPSTLYLGRSEPNGRVTLMSSTSLFLDSVDKQVVLSEIEEFDVNDDYIFATKRKEEDGNLKLLISYKRGDFLEAIFPNELPTQHFHIADVSDGQMFICVTHNETITNLYIGNEPTDMKEPPRFSLSLERIVFFKPNLTWSDSWLNDVTDEPFVELHHVEGLRGVFIASQFKTPAVSGTKFELEQIQSLITFDQGAVWSPLHTPDVDNDGEPIYCKLASNYTKVNCSLHLSQRLNELYPLTRAVPILSKKSGIGLVMATGTVDSSLKGHLGVFLSTDGATHWKQVLQGNYLYNFGDHGGIIVAVQYYKLGELTNNLVYTTDEGNSWKSYKFYEKEIHVLGLMTEPGENTTVFFIFGSDKTNSKHSWVLIKVDMKKAFERQCRQDDYKLWSPSDSQPGRHCLLGRTDYYERRRPNVNCYNGALYERIVRTKPCLCTRMDFECDFGYVEMYSDTKLRCIKDISENSPGVKSEWCKPGELYYNRTKGYRKIPNDACEGGDAEIYLPRTVSCAVKNESEFIIVAKRDSVLRIDLNDFSHVEVLPLGNVRAVVSVDFDVKRNCIFWSDVNKDHIMRLHLDGQSEPELLVSEDLKSVEGLAFDWMASNLYFTDGVLKKIEVIKTDVSEFRRMRKLIIGPNFVDKPRGISVHPAKGYLFWTDWSSNVPYIGRSELDGSNPEKIVTNPVESRLATRIKWPNGITVDLTKDVIYWVDAFMDNMYRADLNGENVEVFLSNDNRISHPFAVGVYNNFVYWDDWTTRSVYTTRTDALPSKEGIIVIQENLSRLMDLKVFGTHSQTGTNQCSNSSRCKELCFSNSGNKTVCQCPDGLVMQGGECLCPDGKPVNNGICASNCNATDVFKCKSGFCIQSKWRCDGEADCGLGDNSDEEGCEARNTCSENQFRCVSDGKCIPLHWQCDFDVDCVQDRSDEMDCPYTNSCNSNDHFQCKNKLCVNSSWRCDGEDDCGDFSDEENCSTPVAVNCSINEFQCANKQCILTTWVCDGDADCLDGSDELNCTGNKCPEWKFQCLTSGECILKSWICDGDSDCKDLSDEVNCTTSSGPVPPQVPGTMFGNCSQMDQMFRCAGNDSLCIPIFWLNDGVKDCPQGDDELDDEENPSHESTITLRPPKNACPDDHFQCESGGCIYEARYCDGITDCPNGDDEPTSCESVFERHCPKGFVKCGLSSICIPLEKLRDGVVDCPNGFDKDFGNSSATDVECNSGEFRCDKDVCLPLYQMCDGNFQCSDGTDELVDVCKTHNTVYQVAGISVEQLEGVSRETAFMEWWLPKTFKGPMEFLPSYCDVLAKICQNSTSWTKERKYVIGNEAALKPLKPFTNYSVTVYVRRNGLVYPPAIYNHFLTLEGPSTPPYNISVLQPDVYNLCVEWNRPLYPNGKILKYSVYFTPPNPPVSVVSLSEKLCISNRRSNPDFTPGTNYTFWVTATNGFNTTLASKAVSYVFHDNVAEITRATVKATSESVVTLEWKTTEKNITEFEVTYENMAGTYQFPIKLKSKTNTITIENLPPGTKFRYIIVPVHKEMHGAPYKGFFSTKGAPLPKVQGLKVLFSKRNIITVTWSPVTDERSKAWTYVVYYGKSSRDINLRRFHAETKETKISLKDLEACENYLIHVGVIGPSGGVGPMSSGKSIMTFMDEKAPPKNIRIVEGSDNASIVISWDAPCPILENPIGYNVNIREVNLNHTYASSQVSSKNAKLRQIIRVPFGGRYEVTVTTSKTGARPSQPAEFEGFPIPPPRMLHQCFACNAPTVYWEPAELPAPILDKGNVSYVVWVSEDESFRKTKSFPASTTSLKLSDIDQEKIYYVAVSVKDSEGLESRLSEHIPLQYFGETSDQISMSTGNVVWVVIAVIVVITLLVAAVGVFFVRYRRLQVSFLNFASTHYSSSSGAAVFQQSMEEEMDSPVIRGFSDDEPLLVA